MTGKEYNEQFSEEELKNEIWKDIPEYEGYYQVSNLGRVKSVDRYKIRRKVGDRCQYRFTLGKLITPTLNGKNYHRVDLYKNSFVKKEFIHKLVLLSFIGARSESQVCRHLDGNKNNNKLSNLCYGTALENQHDRIKHGTHQYGEKNPKSILSLAEVLMMRELFYSKTISIKELSSMFGISSRLISQVCRRINWRWI